MMSQLKIECGALVEVPCFCHHARAKNWCAEIARDPQKPGGLARVFWGTGKGEFYYVLPKGLKPGVPLEFGADYYSAGGRVTRERQFFVVTGVFDHMLHLEQHNTAVKAIKAAKKIKESAGMTSEEHDTLCDICDEYWDEFSKLVARMMDKGPKHLEQHLLAMLQDRSSVYGSKFDEYMERYKQKGRHETPQIDVVRGDHPGDATPLDTA